MSTNTSYHQALTLHQAGDLDTARVIYEKILTVEPNNTAVLHLLGIITAQQKNFALAQHYLKQAIALEPNSATMHNSMGNILKHLNDSAAALQHYQIALKLQPNNAVTNNNIAIIYQQLGNTTAALKHYRQAIAIKPDYADAHYNLSLVLNKQNNLNQQNLNQQITKQITKQITNNNKNNESNQTIINKNDANISEINEAIEHLQITIRLQPQHAQAHCLLAQIYQQQNNTDTALQHYQKAVRIDKNNALTQHNLGALLLAKNKIAAAILHFKKTIQLEPLHREAFYNLGVAFLLCNSPEAALKYFLQLAQWEKTFDVYYNIGVIYSDLGRLRDAITYFNEALQMQPHPAITTTNTADIFAIHVNLGAIYLKQQNYPKAQQHYEAALRLKPDDREIAYILAGINPAAIATTTPSSPNIAPNEYTKHLFDNYARTYDQHLTMLEYRAPQLLYEAITTAINPKFKSLDIIDLGCGTGLCGEKVYIFAHQLIGIDLSEKMLEIAAQKNIYHELKLGDIEESLKQYVIDGNGLNNHANNTNSSSRNNINTRNSENNKKNINNQNDENNQNNENVLKFHNSAVPMFFPMLIIAGDTLPYFGDLENIFVLCHTMLQKQPTITEDMMKEEHQEHYEKNCKNYGYFAFTIEKTSTSPYVLQRSLRFAHSAAYIEKLAKQNNFEVIYTKDVNTRKDRGTAIECLLYILRTNSKQVS